MDAFEIAHSITVEAIRAGVNRPDEITRLFEAIAAQARPSAPPVVPLLADEPAIEPEPELEPEREEEPEPEREPEPEPEPETDARLAPLPSVAWPEPPQPVAKLTPQQIAASYDHEHLNCLECGRRLQRLKHHLNKMHKLRPEEYRERWGLPHDYPMVAAAQSEQFRELALARIASGAFGPLKVIAARQEREEREAAANS